MDQIEVQFPEKVFYSKENATTNDFHITITNGLTRDLLKVNDNENIYPTVCISGLEKLFINEDSMAPFAEALGNGIKDWSVSYGPFKDYGKCLIIKAQQKDIYTVTFSVTNYDFTALSNAKFDCRTKGFGIKIFIDNFNIIYKQYPGHTEMVRSVSAYEMPCIKEFATYYQGEKVAAVPNGEEAEIRWTLGNSDTAFNLYDENDTPLNVISPYKVKINKDQKFKLKVELNGKEISQTLLVKDAPYIEDFYVEDCYGMKTNVILHGKTAKIFWNVRCAEKYSTSLYNESDRINKAISPCEFLVFQDSKITLSLKREDIEVSQTLPIYQTNWCNDRPITTINNLFRPNEKGYDRFFYAQFHNGLKIGFMHFIYVHPKIYVSIDDHGNFNWSELSMCERAPQDFIHYNCFVDTEEPFVNDLFYICYTCKDFIKIIPYNFWTQTWENKICIIRQQWKEPSNNGKLLYCHYFEYGYEKGQYGRYLCAIYDSSIKIYKVINENQLCAAPWTVELPSSTDYSTKIVSIDTSTHHHMSEQNYLAVLCKKEEDGKYKGNQVFLYDLAAILKDGTNVVTPKSTFEFDKIEQKTLYFIYRHHASTLIALDNCIISLNENGKPNLNKSDINFSPTETIIESKQGFMLIGQLDINETTAAIVQNGYNVQRWIYNG